MAKFKPRHDPRGHSLRVYAEIYDSPAFAALSPHDVLAYLALLRVHKGYNNGDLSLPLSRSKDCGIRHPKTLARSLRALCAVGLVALARKGGCTKGGQRLPSLYRLTDRECYEISAKHLEAMPATNDWKRVSSVQKGKELIAAAEAAAKNSPEKLKNQGHGVPVTVVPRELVKAKTRAHSEPWEERPGHPMNMAETVKSPSTMRVTETFLHLPEERHHRAPHSTPLYLYQSVKQKAGEHGQGRYKRLRKMPARFFSNMLESMPGVLDLTEGKQ